MNYPEIVNTAKKLLSLKEILLKDHMKFLSLISIKLSFSSRLFFRFSSKENQQKKLLQCYQKAKQALTKAPKDVQDVFGALVKRIFKEPVVADLLFGKEISKKEEFHTKITHFSGVKSQVSSLLAVPFVDQFVSEISSSWTEGKAKEIEQKIAQQEKHLKYLSQEMQRKDREFQKNVSQWQNEIITTEFQFFDLTNRFYADVQAPFSLEIPKRGELSEACIQEVLCKQENYYKSLQVDVESLIKEKKERQNLLKKSREFINEYKGFCDIFAPFKDLLGEQSHIKELIRRISEIEANAHLVPPEAMKDYFVLQGKEYEKLVTECLQGVQGLVAKEKKLLQDFSAITRTIKRRLFEVFTGTTPFADLKEILETLRAGTVQEAERLQKAFFSSKITIEEYQNGCCDLAYEHDVKQLRKDIMFRSTRLKELREECIKNLQSIYRVRVYIHDVSNPLYVECQAVIYKLNSILEKLRNPFELFKHANVITYESANAVFRHMWIDIEEEQKKVAEIENRIVVHIQANREGIERTFLRAASDLEEALKEIYGKKESLVEVLKVEFGGVKDNEFFSFLREKERELERRFPFVRPFTYFLTLDHHEIRVRTFVEAFHLEESINKIVRFAKTVQSIKMYEEERIDEILEVFELFHVIDDEFEAYKKKLLTMGEMAKVEILLDIGLLDMRAMLDIQEEKLSHALTSALQECEKLAQQKGGVFQGDSSELLRHIREYCHKFFEKKIAHVFAKKGRTAFYESLISKLRFLLLTIEQEGEKQHKEGKAFQEILQGLIPVHAMVEGLELIPEKREMFEKEVTKILNALEELQCVKGSSPESEIRAIQKDILQQLDTLKTGFQFSEGINCLLSYLPGCLKYFEG